MGIEAHACAHNHHCIAFTHGAVEVRNGLRADKFQARLARESRIIYWNNDRLTFLTTGIATIMTTLNVDRVTIACMPASQPADIDRTQKIYRSIANELVYICFSNL